MLRSRYLSRLVEVVVLSLAMYVSVAPLLGEVRLAPDSTNLIVAAQNLVENGEFHVNTNWPSRSLTPKVEPFTDYPPGYTFYLVPFLLLLKDPVLAAAWAQAFSILVCFGGLAFLLHSIKLSLVLRIGGYLLFAVLSNFPLIYSYFLTEPLFLGLSFIGGAFALSMGSDRSKRVTPYLAALCFLLASSIKVIGVFNFAWFLVPLVQQRPFRWRLAIGMAVACTVPLILWFTRNLIVHGQFSFSHRIGEIHIKAKLLVPWNVITHDLLPVFNEHWTGPFVLIILCVILLAPLIMFRTAGSYVTKAVSDGERSIHLKLVLVLTAQFFGIWALSLVTYFSEMDDRLLSPSIAFAVIAGLSGLQRISEVSSPVGRIIAFSSPFAFLFTAMHVTVPRIPIHGADFAYPPEAELWETIDSLGISAGASHYYSDRNFRHQLFSPLPHRILWDTADYSSLKAIRVLATTGTRPFIVFDTTSAELELFEHVWRTDPEPSIKPIPIKGFVVYYAPVRGLTLGGPTSADH